MMDHPDIQELIDAHGGYDRIPPKAFDEYLDRWRRIIRSRLILATISKPVEG